MKFYLGRASAPMPKPKFEDVAISLIRLGSPKVLGQGGSVSRFEYKVVYSVILTMSL